MVRAAFIDKNGVRRGAWSKEEDDKLKAYVEKHGHSNWREIPRLAGLSRCGKSCRLRWINYLHPDVKRGNFTKDEGDLIIKLQRIHGNKWSLIAANLPGRTDNEIKNYWHTCSTRRTKRDPAYDVNKEATTGSEYEPNRAQNLDLDYDYSSMILESSPIYPLEKSSASECFFQLEKSSSATTSTTTINGVGEDGLDSISKQTFKELNEYGDFWRQPFIADNCVYTQNDYPCLVIDGELSSPNHLFYENYGVDLFSDVMQEFSLN